MKNIFIGFVIVVSFGLGVLATSLVFKNGLPVACTNFGLEKLEQGNKLWEDFKAK